MDLSTRLSLHLAPEAARMLIPPSSSSTTPTTATGPNMLDFFASMVTQVLLKIGRFRERDPVIISKVVSAMVNGVQTSPLELGITSLQTPISNSKPTNSSPSSSYSSSPISRIKSFAVPIDYVHGLQLLQDKGEALKLNPCAAVLVG